MYHQLFPPGVSDYRAALRQLQIDHDAGNFVAPSVILEIAANALGEESELQERVDELEHELNDAQNEVEKLNEFEDKYKDLCKKVKKFKESLSTLRKSTVVDLANDLDEVQEELDKIISDF